MNNADYWKERFSELKQRQLDKADDCYAILENEYNRAINSLDKDITHWFQRLAENNEVTYAEAKKMLGKEELKEFKWTVEEYIKKGRENAIDGRWIKELENASARVHIRRYKSLQIQMRQHLEMLTSKKIGTVTETMEDIYRDTFYRSAYEIEKGVGVGARMDFIDSDEIEDILNAPWAPDGSNFSDRIWKDKKKLMSTLDKELKTGLIRGDSTEKIAAVIAKKLEVSKNQARNLVETEAAVFNAKAQIRTYRDLGVEEYDIDATLDTRTSDICIDLDGKVFFLKDAEIGINFPPFHNRCRTGTAPHFDDEFTLDEQRAARNENGELIHVKGDMTYKQWYNKYVTHPTGVGNWALNGLGRIVPTETVTTDHYSPKLNSEPNSVIQYTNKSGGISRNFYDENGFLAKQIHNHPHNNRSKHDFGVKGEHAHYFNYDSGSSKPSRDPIEIKKEDILQNLDILEWLEDEY